MVGIVVTGHGRFPEGVLSAIELVAGRPENVVFANFEAGQSSDDLEMRMTSAIRSLDGEEVLILADLVGGTPFKVSALLKQKITDKDIRVIAGTNLAIAVEAVFSRSFASLNDLVKLVKEAGVSGILDLDALDEDNSEEPVFEDGL